MTSIDVRATNEALQAAYQQTFGNPIGRQVLADLIAYCNGRRTTFDPNDRKHAFNEGKRDVLLRIQELTCLTMDEIYQLRGLARVASKGDTE